MAVDRYLLVDRVVEGSAWSSWRATDVVLSRDVSVTLVEQYHPRRAEAAEAARMAACVTDQKFLHVYDVEDRVDGGLAIVGEWTAGASLVEQVAEAPLTPQEACLLGIHVANALDSAASVGVRHGALGPGDVVLTEDGRTKIRGLGIRQVLEPADPALTQSGDPDGPDAASSLDAWAAAAVTYAALTGRWPGPARDGMPGTDPGPRPRPRQVRAGVPGSLDDAIVAALEDPPARPVTVAEALSTVLPGLGRRISDHPVPTEPDPDTPNDLPWRRVGAGVLAVALVAAAWIGFTLAQEPTEAPGQPPASSVGPTDPDPTPARSIEPDPTGRVPVVAGADFDPSGNGHEHPNQVPLAFDDNLATAWTTLSYQQADLAPKSGVGVVFDLGQVEAVGAVRLNLLGAGTTLQVRVSKELGTRPKDFEKFGSANNLGDLVALRSPTPVQARYVLVWLTQLPADGTTFRGGIAEITVARA